MLTVGLTGGIGSGKSVVAALLVEQGAALIDADVVAREVVAGGTPGLAAVVEAFGPGVLQADGTLDRPRFGELVFGDGSARLRLNAIVHPLIAARTAELRAAAAADVLVHDVPLLVEAGLGPNYHLVVVVDAPVEVRLARLRERGLPSEQARARMAAQADEPARRAAADMWLDNGGSHELLAQQVAALHAHRLLPYARNLRTGQPASRGQVTLVEPQARWEADGARLTARLRRVLPAAVAVEHVGSTAVPGLLAKDIVDVQVEVASWEQVEASERPLAEAGFPRRADIDGDPVRAELDPDPQQWRKRIHLSADPGRPANVHVRVAGTASARLALSFRDRLRRDRQARERYAELKRELVARHPADVDAYAEGKTAFVLRTAR